MAQDFLEPGFINAGTELRRIPIPASMITRKEAVFGFDGQDKPARIMDGYMVQHVPEAVCFNAGLKPREATILKLKTCWMMTNCLAGDSFNISYQRLGDPAQTPCAVFVATGPAWQELELVLPLNGIPDGQEMIFNVVVTGAQWSDNIDLIYFSAGSVRGFWV
jgi:hypothetical protein